MSTETDPVVEKSCALNFTQMGAERSLSKSLNLNPVVFPESPRTQRISLFRPARLYMPTASSAMASSGSYLKGLGADSMLNVVRHLSQKPRRVRWSRFIASKDLLTALRSHETLREAARTVLTCMEVERNQGCNAVRAVHVDHLQSMLAYAASSLTELFVGSTYADPDEPWIHTLPTNAANLRHLDIYYLQDRAVVHAVGAILTAVHGHVAVYWTDSQSPP